MITKQCKVTLELVVPAKKCTLPMPTLRCRRLFSGYHFERSLVHGASVGGVGRKYGAWCGGLQIGGWQIVDSSQFHPAVTSESQNSIYAAARAKSSDSPASSHGSCIGYATVRFAWAFRRSNNAGMSHGEFFCKTVNASGLNP